MPKDHKKESHLKKQLPYPNSDNVLLLPAVVDGAVIPIEEVEDQIFSKKMIGDGYAIRPTGKIIYSPIDGKVEQIASTKHAIYLSTADNLKLLIHIGLDTIGLKGKGFKSPLKKGMAVKRGEVLVEVDPQFIKAEGYNPVVTVVLLNDARIRRLFVYPAQAALGNQTVALKVILDENA